MRRTLFTVGVAALAACAPVPDQPARQRAATLEIRPPAYAVQGLHRWVAADVTEYVVTFKARTDQDGFEALDPPVEIHLAPGAGPRATFANPQPGKRYRAFVAAMGRAGGAAGTDPVGQLNGQATADVADFDFVNAGGDQVQAVTVHLDGTPVDGQATLTFPAPVDGGYASPGAPTMTVSAAPPPP